MTSDPFSWMRVRPKYPASHKLTDDKVRAIRRAYKEGTCQTVLAEQYGVSQSNIHHIVTYKTWVHVTDE